VVINKFQLIRLFQIGHFAWMVLWGVINLYARFFENFLMKLSERKKKLHVFWKLSFLFHLFVKFIICLLLK
jgi:hypothetical protein